MPTKKDKSKDSQLSTVEKYDGDKESNVKDKNDHEYENQQLGSSKHDNDDDNNQGTDNDDVIVGDDKNNHIKGKDGNDIISGMDGNDHLEGGDGNDTLSGGDGNDKLEGGDGNDVIFGGDGNDNIDGDDGDDVLEGGLGIDSISGGDGNDEIIWRAGDGEDKFDGGEGDDTLTVHTSDVAPQVVSFSVNSKGELEVHLDGQDGGDLKLKNIENFKLKIGQAGATIQLGDIPPGSIGNDPIELSGGDGGDVIDVSNSSQPVTIDAGTGDDNVTGGSAADNISGGEGSDVITGGGGDDIIDAGVGDDKVVWSAGDGNDTVDGGDGFDEMNLTLSSTQPASLSISADANGNVILVTDDGSTLTLDGIEDVVINAGSAGTSITIGDLTGTDIAQDTLYFVGGAGDDALDASATDRRINATGNAGNDTLISGSGNDTLSGGAGNDLLDAGSGSGVDNISGGDGDDTIRVTLGDEQDSNAIDLIDGGADNDQLDVLFVEPTPHDLYLRVQSNGNGSFNLVSTDINVNETVRVSNVENLRITAGEGALHFVLDSLSDTTLAQEGVDFIGSADGDLFDGSATDVQLNLHGNDGADTLIGGSANDYLDGGDGDDSLSGGAGHDYLIGGEGDDIFDGGQGFDTVDYAAASSGVSVNLGIFTAQNTGGAGNDALVNIERVIGSAFNDTLTANSLGNRLLGGAGDDILTGGDGFDFLKGGEGNDTLVDPESGLLSGDAGDDFIDGTAQYESDSNGVAVNYSDTDVDVYGDGSLVVAARTAIDGYGDTDTFGAGAVDLHASNYNDQVTGSDASQNFWLRAGNDQLDAGAGDDTIFTGSGSNVVDGSDGVDTVNYQDDGYDGAGPAAQGINANLATGIISNGFGGTDSVSNIENIIGSELNDTLVGDDNANSLFARGGDDIIHGGGGNDVLAGWSGNDIINGDDGDDAIIGDADDDTLSGGAGADTYIFNTFSVPDAAFGHDTITDFDVAEDRLNLALFEISNLADFQAIASDDGTNTTVKFDGDRSILLQNVTVAQLTASNFIFAEGSGPSLTGTEDNDVLVGTPSNDFILGLGGNDSLEGLAGNDTLYGGDGRDLATYANDPAAVSVDLALGTATDGYGDTDTLVGIENVRGTDFADTIIGDANSNTLWGDATTAGGADIIYGGDGDDYIIGGGGIDTIDGGAGLDLLYLTQEGIAFNQLGLTVTFEADNSITVFNPAKGETESGILNIEGVIGSIGTDTITGNAQDNYIQGFYGNNQLDGGAGIDTLFYGLGAPVTVNLETGISFRQNSPWLGTDTLSNFENAIGGAGDDILIGDYQDNVLEGSDGDDELRGNAGNDILNGGASTLLSDYGNPDQAFDGFDVADYSADPAAVSVNLATASAIDGWGDTDTLISIEAAIGSEYADTLIGDDSENAFMGLGGNDTLTGAGGADYFVLSDDEAGNANFGLDTVTDFNVAEDVIEVRAFSNISASSQLNISQDGADALITFEAGNVLRLNGVNAASLTDANFEFAESQILNGTEANDNLTGGDGNDVINGYGGNDQLRGEDGDDFIDGGAGFDNLYGGAGNDTINGGADWDNIWGDAGDDVINSNNGFARGGTGNDTITGSITLWDELHGEEGDDVLIDTPNTGFVVGGPGNDTLDGRPKYEGDPSGVLVNLDSAAWDVFGDGSQILASRTAIDGYGDTDILGAGAIDLNASYFDDHVRGSEFSQFFDLRAGNDTAFGLTCDDSFRGGSGDDYIDGGDGSDNVNYSDDGYDGNGSATQGIVLNLSSSDFAYDYNGSSGIALANSAIDDFGDTDSLFNIEHVRGSDLNDIIIGSDVHNWLDGGPGDDQIYGLGTNDNLIGNAGNDYLVGGDDGGDTAWYNQWDILNGIDVNLADGKSYNDGYGDIDTLVGIENVEGTKFDDFIVGDANNNFIAGNGGNDIIHGGDGDDGLDGRDGDDQVFGENGNDRFHASAGTDLMDGGSGRDTVTYESFLGTTSGVTLDMNNVTDAGGFTNVVVVSSDGFGAVDYLRSIERFQLTDHNDNVIADAGDNDLYGYAGNDTLIGGAGNDYIEGGDDFDVLDGGVGNDTLDGGENGDTLTGGAGYDNFRFSRFTNDRNPTSFGEDVITDFSVSEDRLDLYNVPEFTSLEALQAAATQAGADVLIAFDTVILGVTETNSIRLQNLSLADLPNMNISFAPVQGTDGDDVLNGSEFGESMNGYAGNDVINGFGGNDNLLGGAGNDTLDGGDGYDNANYRWSGEWTGVTVDLGSGSASNDGFGNVDTLLNIENVEGTEFDDTITGDALSNYLNGREGNDLMHGGDGNDNLHGEQGDDALYGDAGDDQLVGRQGNDLLDGGDGVDRVQYDAWTGTSSGVTIDLGNIVASAGGHSNVVVVANDGMGGTDYLRNVEGVFGTDFADNLTGDAQHNQLIGQGGDDIINGNGGNDSVEGYDGNDILNGGDGDDYITGGRGADTIDGGAGWDHLGFTPWTGVSAGVNVNLALNQVIADGTGSSDTVFNIESMTGSAFDDILVGDANSNYLDGSDGNDTLSGGGGSDMLVGGNGNDLFMLSDGENVSIQDFVAGAATEDVISFAGVSSLTDFNSVLAAASDDGIGNTNIDLGGGSSVHLVGLSVANLHADDFVF
mgnify:CR=1 FL=1